MPVEDYVAATSVGMVEGTAVLDLAYEEDSTAGVDMNIVKTGNGRFIEVQEPRSTRRLTGTACSACSISRMPASASSLACSARSSGRC